MNPEAVVFDIYGTLIDIRTDESDITTYKEISHFLKKYDFIVDPALLREQYFSIQKKWSREKNKIQGIRYPEVRIVDVFKEILKNHTQHPTECPEETVHGLSETLPLLFRELTIKKIGLLPHVIPTLEELDKQGYKLSIISNAQTIIAVPELNKFNLIKYFYPIILSSDYGVKKPEKTLFMEYLRKMKLTPEQIVFVGNDMRDDIFGAQRLGIKTIFVDTPIGLDEYKNTKPDIYVTRMDEILEHL